MTARILLLLELVCAVGCLGRKAQDPQPHARQSAPLAADDGKLHFQLSPPDLTTAADSEAIAVWADARGPVDLRHLEAVAAQTTLVTWPENEPLSWAPSFAVAATGRESDPYSKVLIHSSAPLTPRWYALKVGRLPDSEHLGVRAMSRLVDTASTGETLVRFRIGSEPRIVGIVETYDPTRNPGHPYALAAQLSEVLPFDLAESAVAIAGPGTDDCVRIPKYSEIATTVVFRCASSVIGTVKVTLAELLSRNLAAALASGSPSSTVIEVNPDKIESNQDGPRTFKRFFVEGP